MRVVLSAALAIVTLLAPVAAIANDPERTATEEKLRQAEAELSKAETAKAIASGAAAAMAAEVATLQAAVRNAAADVRRHEHVIAERAASLEELKQRQAAYLTEWNDRRAQIGGSVAALVRLSSVPPSAAMIQDGSTVDRLRSAFVLRGIIPRLNERARLLREDLNRLKQAAAAVAEGQEALVTAKAVLEQKLTDAEALTVRKNALLQSRQLEAAKAIAAASRQAKSAATLRAFIARLDDARGAREAAIAAERARRAAIVARAGAQPQPESGPPLQLVGLERSRGGLLLPVAGKVVRQFGEGKDAFSHGITITASPGTPVLSPADGRVRYAGEFQNYGLVLIVDHGGGFHSVLTGLTRVTAVTDQWVLAGEPLGRLADHGSLYVEIRRNRDPVDPLLWFTVDRS